MKPYSVTPAASFKARISLPGDKSIACRAVIIGSISNGRVVIENFPLSKDCLSAINVFRNLGVRISRSSRAAITISARGLNGLRKPAKPVSAGESGTTLRLTLGVLAGQNFKVKLVAGKSLSGRPMRRVTGPLRLMGAKISAKRKTQNAKLEEYPPITIEGGSLKPITYRMPVASAQVKSAIVLAGLYARGRTRVIEPVATRDHTERMLKLFKAGIKTKKNVIVVEGGKELTPPKRLYIPGDISSAGFFMVLAAIMPDTKIIIEKVGLNPSRMGIVRILKRMGADIKITNYARQRFAADEPIGNITVKSSRLKGAVVRKEEIPSLIDELPILMVAACFAKGRTVFRGVGELRVKETDRINSMTWNLLKMGGRIKIERRAASEDVIMERAGNLNGAAVKSFGDHRTAMSMIIAGLKAQGKTTIDDISCIDKSFPDFLDILRSAVR